MNTEINVKSAKKIQVFISEYTRNLMGCSSERKRVMKAPLFQRAALVETIKSELINQMRIELKQI